MADEGPPALVDSDQDKLAAIMAKKRAEADEGLEPEAEVLEDDYPEEPEPETEPEPEPATEEPEPETAEEPEPEIAEEPAAEEPETAEEPPAEEPAAEEPAEEPEPAAEEPPAEETPAAAAVVEEPEEEEEVEPYDESIVAPEGAIVLPPGALGITFAGSPPTVKKMSESSPAKGLVTVGDVVQKVVVPGKLEATDMSSKDLGQTLRAYAALDTRCLVMATPEPPEGSTAIVLPTGALGIIFNGSPVQIKSVKDESPVKEQVFPGQFVVKLVIPGVVSMEGMDSKEMGKELKANADVEGRTIYVTGEPIIPAKTNIPLPAGKIGVTFNGAPAAIKKVAEDSPLAKDVEVGQVVSIFKVAAEDVLTNPSAFELGAGLKEHEESTDRVLIMVGDPDAAPPPEPTKPKNFREWFFELCSVDVTLVHQALMQLLGMDLLSAQYKSMTSDMISKGGGQTVLTALHNHHDTEEVAVMALHLMLVLSAVGNEEFQATIFELNGSKDVVDTMNQYPENKLIQTHGLGLLLNLAPLRPDMNNPKSTKRKPIMIWPREWLKAVVDNGAIPTTVAAMNMFDDDDAVQKRGCQFFVMTSQSEEEWRKEIRAAKGLSAMSHTLQTATEAATIKVAKEAMKLHMN